MKLGYLAFPLAFALVVQTSCSDRSSQQQEPVRNIKPPERQQVREVAPDIRDGWQWSAAEVAALTRSAQSGDVAAANKLFQYYSVHEDRAKMTYWEDWLFKRGDPGSTELRVHRIYSTARQRDDDDPRKLAELQEAEQLWLSVHPENMDNPFLDRLRSEIASVKGTR